MKLVICASLIAFCASCPLGANENPGPDGPILTSPMGPSPEELESKALLDSPYVIRPVFRKPVSKSRILSLYHQLRAGQTRSEVEKILGNPIIGSNAANGSEQWYINETEKRKFNGSPWGMAGIRVFYDQDGLLASATYNYQYVREKHIKRYLKKYGKKAEQ